MSDSVPGPAEAAFVQRFSSRLAAEVSHFVADWEDRAGARLKLDPGTQHGVVLAYDGEVVGFATADAFGGDDLEVAAAVDSADDWEVIRPVIGRHAHTVGASDILLIVDPRDVVMRAVVGDAVPRSVELRLSLDASTFAFGHGARAMKSLALRPADDVDIPFITGLELEAFGRSDPRFVAGEVVNTALVLVNEIPVGKARVERHGTDAGVYGLAIAREWRNRGIGTAALALVVQELIDGGATRIYLEVDAGNSAAIHVYESLGFRKVAEFRYYALPVD